MSSGHCGMTDSMMGDPATTMSLSLMQKLLIDRGVQQKHCLEKLQRDCSEQEERLDYLRAEVREGQMRQEALDDEHLAEMSKRPQVLERSSALYDRVKEVWNKKECTKNKQRGVEAELAAIRAKPAVVDMKCKLEKDYGTICTRQDHVRKKAKLVMARLSERTTAKIRHKKMTLPLDDYTTEIQRLADVLASICLENQEIEKETAEKEKIGATADEESNAIRADCEKKHKEINELLSEIDQVKNLVAELKEKSESSKIHLQDQTKQFEAIGVRKKELEVMISVEEPKKVQQTQHLEDLARQETCLLDEETKLIESCKAGVQLKQKYLAEVVARLEKDKQTYEDRNEALPKTLKSAEELNEQLRSSLAALDGLRELVIKEKDLKEKWNMVLEEESKQDQQLDSVKTKLATFKKINDAAEEKLMAARNTRDQLKMQHSELLSQKEELENDIANCGLTKEQIAETERQTGEGEEAKIVQLSRSIDEWKKQAQAEVQEARTQRDILVRDWASEITVLQEEFSKKLAEKNAEISKLMPQVEELKARKDAENRKISQEVKALEEQVQELKDKNGVRERELEDDDDDNDEELSLADISIDHPESDTPMFSSPIKFDGIRHSTPLQSLSRDADMAQPTIRRSAKAKKTANENKPPRNQSPFSQIQPMARKEDKMEEVTFSSRGRRLYKPPKLSAVLQFDSDDSSAY